MNKFTSRKSLLEITISSCKSIFRFLCKLYEELLSCILSFTAWTSEKKVAVHNNSLITNSNIVTETTMEQATSSKKRSSSPTKLIIKKVKYQPEEHVVTASTPLNG